MALQVQPCRAAPFQLLPLLPLLQMPSLLRLVAAGDGNAAGCESPSCAVRRQPRRQSKPLLQAGHQASAFVPVLAGLLSRVGFAVNGAGEWEQQEVGLGTLLAVPAASPQVDIAQGSRAVLLCKRSSGLATAMRESGPGRRRQWRWQQQWAVAIWLQQRRRLERAHLTLLAGAHSGAKRTNGTRWLH